MSMTVDDMKNIVITFVNIAEEQLEEKSFREMDDAGTEILKALDELEQYEAIGTVKVFETVIKSQMEYFNRMREYEKIGTVEEFRELKEKATPKKIGRCVFYKEMGYATPWQCLTCGADQIEADFSCEDGSELEEKHTFCWNCGQKLDWSE